MSGHMQSQVYITSIGVAAHAAATATESTPIFVCDRAVKIRKVSFVPKATVTGANSNTTHLNLLSGSTEVANIDLTAGTDLAIAQRTLYAPTTPLSLAAGTVLFLQQEKVGNGLDVPALAVFIEYEPA